MRQLRQPGHDVADGVYTRLARLHVLVSVNEAALGLDVRQLFQPDTFRSWSAANRHQALLGLNRLLFTLGLERHLHAVLGSLQLLEWCVRVAGNTAFAI